MLVKQLTQALGSDRRRKMSPPWLKTTNSLYLLEALWISPHPLVKRCDRSRDIFLDAGSCGGIPFATARLFLVVLTPTTVSSTGSTGSTAAAAAAAVIIPSTVMCLPTPLFTALLTVLLTALFHTLILPGIRAAGTVMRGLIGDVIILSESLVSLSPPTLGITMDLP